MQLADLYAQQFAANDAERKAVWRVLVDHYFQRFIPDDATVLDLGAGNCEFINQVRASRRIAVDVDPGSRNYASRGVDFVQHDVSRPWPLPDASIHVVFTSNFLEHLPDKLALTACLEEAFRVLRPQGRLIAMGPNIRFCGNVYWDSLHHLIPLSDRSMTEALQLRGFQPEMVIPRFLPHRMVSKGPHPSLVRIYLAIPFTWRILGRQFLVIARKPQ